LKSSDGEAFEVEAEGLCYARRTFQQAADIGPDAKIELPFKKAIVAKVCEYFKYHKDVPPQELKTPLTTDNLVECGASKWDAQFVNCDRDLLFELMVASSMMDIPSLLFIAGAKASLLIKERSPDKLIKDFKMSNDLPEEEDEALSNIFTEQMERMRVDVDESGIGGIGLIINSIFQAAEKNNVYASTRGDAPGPSKVSLKSYRHSSWRAMILSDWTKLDQAPEEVVADRDLMFAAMGSSQGQALRYCSSELREDRKLVMEAVKYNGEMLSEASSALRSDASFVMEAILLNSTALGGAADGLRHSRDMVLEAAKLGKGSAMKGAMQGLQSDKGLILECVSYDPEVCLYMADELRHNRGFAMELVMKNGAVLQYLPYLLRADRDIVATAAANDPRAIYYAHTSARADLGAALPHDTEGILFAAKEEQDRRGVGALPPVQPGKYIRACVSKAESDAMEVKWYKHKAQRMVQFSALSTMTANMGQSNYIAANSFLDKITFYERPEVDSVTLMWGAVGNIGMRWKAFASADMLNANPEALMQVPDAAKVLNVTTNSMGVPEWYAASFFDEWTRQSILAPTAIYRSEDYQPPVSPIRVEGKAPTRRSRKPDEEARSMPETGPLGGWPILGDYASALPEEQDEDMEVVLPDADLEEGGRVQLTGLQAKTGMTGTLLKHNKDGKWKVRMDADGGVALLKERYLVAVAGTSTTAPTSTKKQDGAARREKLKATLAEAQEPAATPVTA